MMLLIITEQRGGKKTHATSYTRLIPKLPDNGHSKSETGLRISTKGIVTHLGMYFMVHSVYVITGAQSKTNYIKIHRVGPQQAQIYGHFYKQYMFTELTTQR